MTGVPKFGLSRFRTFRFNEHIENSSSSSVAPAIGDYVFVLSGGSTNTDPAASLGGDPSAYPVSMNALNNLFQDVSSDEDISGGTDYRCVYFFNDSDTTLNNVEFWIQSQVPGGATAQLGLSSGTDIQEIIVTGVPTGGTLVINIDGENFAWQSGTVETMIGELEGWFFSLTFLHTFAPDVNPTVVAVANGTFYSFIVTLHGNSSHTLFNTISGSFDNATVTYMRMSSGGPINSIAPIIPNGMTAPPGVSFKLAPPNDPFVVGDMGTMAGLPFWIERITAAGAPPTNLDGCLIRFAWSQLAPSSSSSSSSSTNSSSSSSSSTNSSNSSSSSTNSSSSSKSSLSSSSLSGSSSSSSSSNSSSSSSSGTNVEPCTVPCTDPQYYVYWQGFGALSMIPGDNTQAWCNPASIFPLFIAIDPITGSPNCLCTFTVTVDGSTTAIACTESSDSSSLMLDLSEPIITAMDSSSSSVNPDQCDYLPAYPQTFGPLCSGQTNSGAGISSLATCGRNLVLKITPVVGCALKDTGLFTLHICGSAPP